jgi:hypothetical protein
LRGIKYLLLLLFVKFIFLDMSVEALGRFLDALYWAVSDVKMLHFFARSGLLRRVAKKSLCRWRSASASPWYYSSCRRFRNSRLIPRLMTASGSIPFP